MKFSPCALILFSQILLVTPSFPQGSLTPPGSPAPTMKSLDQIEARTPITSLPFTISASGSYYLTGNLTGPANDSTTAITVNASNVTIDLNGFTMTGGAGNNANGIILNNGLTNLCVRNGGIVNWNGYGLRSSLGSVGRFEKLRMVGNGTGPYVGPNSTVVDCSIINSSSYGIVALGQCLISHCVSRGNSGYGILVGDDCSVLQSNATANTSIGIQAGNGCVIADCVADGDSQGIITGTNAVVRDCTASNNTGTGITVGTTGTVRGCTAQTNTGTGANGITCGNDCTVQSCTVSGNSGSGVQTGIQGTVQGTTADANLGNGIQFGDNSSVLHCNASGNTSASGLAAYNAANSTNASGCTIGDSTAGGNYNGIGVGNGSAIRGCTVRANSHNGIQLNGTANQIIGNTVDANNSSNTTNYAGLAVVGNNNRIDSNTFTANNGYGLIVANGYKGNLIIRNSFTQTFYSSQSGDSVGPSVSQASGGSISSTSPWANFYTDN